MKLIDITQKNTKGRRSFIVEDENNSYGRTIDLYDEEIQALVDMFEKSPNSKRYDLEERKTIALEKSADVLEDANRIAMLNFDLDSSKSYEESVAINQLNRKYFKI